MIERVIEHWLTSTNERGFEIPYCQLLISKGFKVLHLSPHGPAEQGKDIICIDQKGVPCAFQLKAGRIGRSELNSIHGEINQLVELPIQYPGISQRQHHAYLVTNGDLTDTARVDLHTMNQGFKHRGLSTITVVTKGDLLADFLKAQGSFMPVMVPDFNRFLQLLLWDGRDMLPKPEVAKLLESVLVAEYQRPKTEIPRAMAGTALLIGYSLGNQYSVGNHVAVLEGWILLGGYVLAMAEQYQLAHRTWQPTFDLAMQGARLAMQDLRAELVSRDYLVEDYNILYDGLVYGSRLTIMFGYMAAMCLSAKLAGATDWVDETLDGMLDAYGRRLCLYGEGAVPFLFAIALYVGARVSSLHGERLMFKVLDAILACNGSSHRASGLLSPYYDLDTCLRVSLGFTDRHTVGDSTGISYTAGSVLHFLCRRLYRQSLRFRWHRISRVQSEEFIAKHPWQLLHWHNEEGETRIRYPKQRQSWAEMREQCRMIDPERIPGILQLHPEYLPLFLCAYPHRFTPNLSKWLDRLVWS